jgi:putative glutathione S-transferase
MGMLVDGIWQDVWYDTKSTGGRFKRQESIFRQKISHDGSTPFAPAANRYHLYISQACPWAHRTLIFRKLKKLEDVISVSGVQPYMLDKGWEFNAEYPDHIHAKAYLHEIYCLADPQYTGRVTVPILWDKETQTMVNNESTEIIRMLNDDFNAWGDAEVDFFPGGISDEMAALDERIYHTLNNGVYKTGFATSQEAYEESVVELFATLDFLEEHLASRQYLAGDVLTASDWRLFPTLIRFDAVYVGHFKCNLKRIADYAHLRRYTRELYRYPGVAETVDIDHCKAHYYGSHKTVNPSGVIPKGPVLDYL